MTTHGPLAARVAPQALLVVSQTSLTQTALPTSGLQTPVSGGVWPPTVGIGVPLTSCATQVGAGRVPVLHHCVVAQLLSWTHALPQAPVDSQTLPAWVAAPSVHVVVPPTLPQVVHAAPLPGQ